MAKKSRKSVSRLTDLFALLNQNETPITVLGPTPYGFLGLDGWVGNLQHICALNGAAGLHHSSYAPETERIAMFHSALETCNELLRHSEVRAHMKARGPGLLWPADADEETLQLAKELGQAVMLPELSLRRKLHSDGGLRQLLGKSGVAFVPQITATVSSYEELTVLAHKAKLGPSLVVSTTDEAGEHHTSFVSQAADWDAFGPSFSGKAISVSRYVLHTSYLVEVVAAPTGVVCGPLLQVNSGAGFLAAVASNESSDEVRPAVHSLARKAGAALHDAGLAGMFCCKIYVEAQTGKAFLKSVTARPGLFSQLSHHITATYGGLPLGALHVLPHLGADCTLDTTQLQKRWQDFGTMTVAALTFAEGGTDFITTSPASSIYGLDADGQAEMVVPSISPHDIHMPRQALFLRTLGTGAYRQNGIEYGLLVSRNNLLKNGQFASWQSAITNLFATVQMSGTSLPGSSGISGRASLF